MKVKILVGICRLDSPDVVTEAVYVIPEYLEHLSRPIDYPSVDTDAFTAEFCCTPVKVREAVERNRKQFADEISAAIVRLLSKDDTVMGYKREF